MALFSQPTFRFKLLLMFIALLGITLGAILYSVLQATDRTVELNIDRELRVGKRVLQSLLYQNSSQLSDRARLLSEDFGFKQAVATEENDTIASVLANHGRRIEADMVVLLAPTGDIIVSTHSADALIRHLNKNIVKNQQSFSVLTLAEGKPHQLVMVPVHAPELIAWVGLGFAIDQSLMQAFKQITGTDISFIYWNDDPSEASLMSTLPGSLRPADDSKIDSRLLPGSLEQAGWINERVELLRNDLFGSDAALVALLSINLQYALASYAPLRWQIIAIVLIALAVAAMIIALFSGNITRPIDTLVAAAKRIAGGDYRSHVDLKADNEFGLLSKALSNMQDAIYEREKQMEQAQLELRLAQKLEAVGQLAAGIAHEINTPMQFIGDHVDFLKTAHLDLQELLLKYHELQVVVSDIPIAHDLLAQIESIETNIDLAFLQKRCPQAFDKTQGGIERVAKIVQAMKEFAYPGQAQKAPADINQAIENTLIVAKNEYKYIADVETELLPLPPVICHIGDLNQVFLNLIVNAAHAIEAKQGGRGKGLIRIETQANGGDVEIRITDSGTGIPAEVQSRIFDPFFTTKEIGKGSGQGLAITRSIIVEKHDGEIMFETQSGEGTCFVICLPVNNDNRDASPNDQPAQILCSQAATEKIKQ